MPEVKPTENSQTPAVEDEGTQKPTPESESEGTGRTDEPKEDYREKFAASTREAQRLLEENRRLMEQSARISAERDALEKQAKELEELAKGNSPEGFDALQLRKHVETLNRSVSEMKEAQAINDFIASVPEAANYRETLRDMGRAYPGKSYRDIWETSLKAVSEAESLKAEAKRSRRESTPDSGSSTGEPTAETVFGMSLDKFNSLSVEKRKEIMKKHGVPAFKLPEA